MDYFNRAKKFRTKKRLGQNFLIDENVIDFIVEKSQPQEKIIVEIGSGAGFVTEKLIEHAKKVFAIEIDEDAIRLLNKLQAPNLATIHKDVLKVDFSEFTNNDNEKLTIVANIPYYITSPILVHLLGEIDNLNHVNRNSIDEIILMVQFEVAQRLVAKENSPSKQFGLLSILAQFFADAEILKKVNAKSFYPKPKVDSAIVKFKIKNKPLINLKDYTFFRKVVKAIFMSRRKNIKNALINNGFDKDCVIKTLQDLAIPENTRGETLSIEKLGVLSEKLKENLCKK